MSSRSLAAARARRAGENAPPVSGGRPVTSIGSQAAFAQQMPNGMGYNMPPPPSNVRTARAMQPPPRQPQYQQPPPQQYYDQQQQQPTNGLPFSKLSVSDAIGLITLRLGRVEQWIIETDHEEQAKDHTTNGDNIPDNHRVIDNSVLSSMISRLDSLEKNGLSQSATAPPSAELAEEIKSLKEQFKNVSDIVTKHTLELAKNTEQVFRFNRELTETKDILKSFMVKYDMFTQETTKSFTDYEAVFADYDALLEKMEKRLPLIADEQEPEGTSVDTNASDATDGENIIMTVDLKNMIKQELSTL